MTWFTAKQISWFVVYVVGSSNTSMKHDINWNIKTYMIVLKTNIIKSIQWAQVQNSTKVGISVFNNAYVLWINTWKYPLGIVITRCSIFNNSSSSNIPKAVNIISHTCLKVSLVNLKFSLAMLDIKNVEN